MQASSVLSLPFPGQPLFNERFGAPKRDRRTRERKHKEARHGLPPFLRSPLARFVLRTFFGSYTKLVVFLYLFPLMGTPLAVLAAVALESWMIAAVTLVPLAFLTTLFCLARGERTRSAWCAEFVALATNGRGYFPD